MTKPIETDRSATNKTITRENTQTTLGQDCGARA